MVEGRVSFGDSVTDTGTGTYQNPAGPRVYGEELPANPHTDAGTASVVRDGEPTTYEYGYTGSENATDAYQRDTAKRSSHEWPGRAVIEDEQDAKPAKKTTKRSK